MSESPLLTPPGRAWASAHADLITDVEVMLAGAEHDRRRAFVIESALVALVSQFQLACRNLLALAASEIEALIGGELGVVVERGLVAGSRLARGNANASNLAADFLRVGVHVWDLPFPVGMEGMTARWALDDVNECRNELAHGRDPEVDDEGLVLADVHDTAKTLDMLLRTIERGVVERLTAYGAARDNRIGGD
jgi:hypothetical protein